MAIYGDYAPSVDGACGFHCALDDHGHDLDHCGEDGDHAAFCSLDQTLSP